MGGELHKMRLSLTEKECKVLKACLDEGSKRLLRLIASPHLDEPTRIILRHDNLVIITIYNKLMRALNIKPQ